MNKILTTKTEQGTRIEISAAIPKTKLTLLFVWLILWTLCGIIVFSQFFTPVSRETKLMMAIWFAFWAYFEYRVAFIYGWRKNGKEVILANKTQISIQRCITGKEKIDKYSTENLSDLKVAEYNKFAQNMSSSFWVTGAETIWFKNLGRQIGFGLQLNEQEAKQLFKLLKPYVS